MSNQVRYAILDTDFVSKANIIQVNNRVLADEVISFPDYRFVCHAKMIEELAEHGSTSAQAWLDQRIKSGEITCYDDQRILDELSGAIGEFRFGRYRTFLKEGCNMFRNDYYDSYFGSLDKLLEAGHVDDKSFLAELGASEAGIGHKNNYGEIKAYVLMRMLQFLHGDVVTVFCSDDFGARQGFANTAMIPCISILGVYYKLYLLGKSYEEVQPYYQSYVDWLADSDVHPPQHSLRVWIHVKGALNREHVTAKDVLLDIYAGKYIIRKDGDLQRE